MTASGKKRRSAPIDFRIARPTTGIVQLPYQRGGGALRRRVDSYQLLVAVGRFTAADLRLQVTLYDATANYNKVRNEASPLP